MAQTLESWKLFKSLGEKVLFSRDGAGGSSVISALRKIRGEHRSYEE
jgi:hypothetical protein